jgi:hypothetical protein
MAGGFSDAWEKKVLDAVFGATALTVPGTLYAALLTDTNTSAQRSAGTVTEVSTATWTNYARVAITNNTTNFPAATGTTATKQNGTAINFGTATISGAAPVVTAIAFYDASTAGNLVFWVALSSSQTINNGASVSVAANGISMTLNET